MNGKSSPALPSPEVPYPSLVGQVIKQARQAHGVQQADLAAILGMTQSAYSRLESGDSVLNIWQLRQCAHALGMTPAVLLAEVERAEARLSREGLTIVAEKKTNPAAAIVGIALLVALLSKM